MSTLTAKYIEIYPELKNLAIKFFRKNNQDAEDALHQLWMNLYNSKTKDETIIDKKAFIKTGLFNACLNLAAKNRASISGSEKLRVTPLITARYFSSNPESDILNKELANKRQELIANFTNKLKPVQRNIFLQLLNEKSINEIAIDTSSVYNSVKHNRRILVQKLKKYFADNGEEFEYDKVSGTI